MRRAVIDIGTNSVKVLIADVNDLSAAPVWEESEQTRLGQGFYETRVLAPEAILRTAQAVTRFAAIAREHQAHSLRVIATSIGREALNHAELTHAVKHACGLNLEIISGEQEAEWAFTGVRTDRAYRNCPLLILDVGGGSTEFILGEDSMATFRRSFPIGSVRLLEHIAPEDPPTPENWRSCSEWLAQVITNEVMPLLMPCLSALRSERPVLVGTGGTTSILAAMELQLPRFERARIESVMFSRSRIWEVQKRLWRLPIAKRRTIPGLPANRADVILFGVAIYAHIMDLLGFEAVRVSTRGLRFGAIADPTR